MSFVIRKRSLMKILKRKRPNIKPCGTLKSIYSNELYGLLVLTLCLGSFNLLCINLNDVMSNP